ncbi:hypothetical protein PV04_04925 [Phialophora macrospora]|uniref:Ketoreductase (KR) domain-containing protein n=1 Tax=Phialophora macrospora TaxID=1851006 RepID=A0A0D2CV72_9EURO|nr:hypothetical protein PV04_04925 [Phialophora macrospora]
MVVDLKDVCASNGSLVQRQPLVAVFFGGTGGIGSYTIRALATAEAKNNGKGLRMYIVGRNAAAADRILAECREIFDRLCREIITAEEQRGSDARIDYLMMSHAGMPYLPRKDTPEGLDTSMSLMYYSRMRILTTLLPLLLRSRLPATVVSVYAAGAEAKLYPADLSLREPRLYSYSQARSHMCYMHCLFFEHVAAAAAGHKLSLIHIFPGLVPGPGYHDLQLPLWFRVLFHYVLLPFFGRWLTVKPRECGERMVSLAATRASYPAGTSDPDPSSSAGVKETSPGSGVYSLTWSGESNYPAEKYAAVDKEGLRTKVYEHTMKAFQVIEEGGVFAE